MTETPIPIGPEALESLLNDTIQRSPEKIELLRHILATMSPDNPRRPCIESNLLALFGIKEERVAELRGTIIEFIPRRS